MDEDFKEAIKSLDAIKMKMEEERKHEYGRLKHAIMSGHHTDDEWLQLARKVREFIAGDHPQEEKDSLGGVTECLVNICLRIADERLKDKLEGVDGDERYRLIFDYLEAQDG